MMGQIMDGSIITTYHASQHYKTVFNKKTGFFVRKEDQGFSEPFWAYDGPELLDLSITSFCRRECPFCYRQANHEGHHMALDDVELVLSQAKDAGVLQIAIGGGNPNQHPYFVKILQMIHEYGMVPSYTTNGEGLSDEILQATKKYCGAMAISVYSPYNVSYYKNLIKRVSSLGIRVNLHIIINTDTYEHILKWLRDPSLLFNRVNAVVFLNYKPVIKDKDLSIKDDKLWKTLFKLISECTSVKIGFDSCSIPGIVSHMDSVPDCLLEACEAARFSAFISEDLKMYPCSFMANTNLFISLKDQPLLKVWRESVVFKTMRNKIMNNSCVDCKFECICHGGCALFPEINNCTCHNIPEL